MFAGVILGDEGKIQVLKINKCKARPHVADVLVHYRLGSVPQRKDCIQLYPHCIV
jgi:hypothetical protein